jgi:hypothetical protein
MLEPILAQIVDLSFHAFGQFMIPSPQRQYSTVCYTQSVWLIGVGGQYNGPPKINLVAKMVNIVFSLVHTVATALVMCHLLLICGLH